ncbi:hypothetical protein BRADI_1g69500v3 [Brachypodium distachyon]|uniref:Uncharacterized protein n=1 Tax=Brachypodium distachyon TaxID=15368 RepID=A0A0Q3HIM9_BRADI|nr:hypothetical protein BRADI_1g69500v3 [Brachypodium distachyon]
MSQRRLLLLMRNVRLAAASSSRSFHLPAVASISGSNDGNSSYSFNRRLGSTFGAILIGQAAFFLGLGNNCVLAQDDSAAPASTISEKADANVTSLHRIEDGSVISNEHTVKWRIFTDKARDFFLKGELDEAEKFFKAALHEAKEGFGLGDPHAASALNNLAEFYRLRKEYEKAEPLYVEAIEILEQSFGPDDIRVGAALRNLGQHYHIQRRFDQAQTCYEIQGRVMGLGHPDYANTMYLLAKVLSQQRKGKDAEALIRESIRILEEAGLGESPTCIQRMRFLSMELVKLGRLAEAENLQRKILHSLELSKGWDSLDTTIAAETLSFTLQTMGKLKEPEEILERCLSVRKKILSEDHFQVAGILVHLARLTLLQIVSDIKVNNDLSRSNLVKAKQLVNDSIRITEAILNPLRKDQKKLNSRFAMEIERIAATAVLLQALEVVGLIEAARRIQAPAFDYQHVEQALRKCISLYNEPHTRNIVSKAVRQHYVRCLSSLILIIQRNPLDAPQLQDLLGESQQIMKELEEENNMK